MKQFEVGKTYTMFSPGNTDCIWTYKVVARTAQTVTLKDLSTNYREQSKAPQRFRINKQTIAFRNAETVYPLGQYSLCPSLTA